jgi:hypothetical protein
MPPAIVDIPHPPVEALLVIALFVKSIHVVAVTIEPKSVVPFAVEAIPTAVQHTPIVQ